MLPQAVFFDFDGVILDSVDVKTRAFAELFREYGPGVQQAVVDYHLAHGGVSRFRKFEYYYEHLLGKELSGSESEELGRRFNALVLDGVLAAPFIQGVPETLRGLEQARVPAVVASGTPEEELKVIVERRGLASFFLEVHGSPRLKREITQDVCARHDFEAGRCLFVGDALTDYDAAVACGMPFLGVVKDARESPFPKGTPVAEGLSLESLRIREGTARPWGS